MDTDSFNILFNLPMRRAEIAGFGSGTRPASPSPVPTPTQNGQIMKYGTLELICGPMFAGKTTELLKRILWAKSGDHLNVVVLKPAFDTRYGENRIATHNGLSADAIPIREWPEIPSDTDILFLDEVQFFEPPHADIVLPDRVIETLRRGIHVVAAGLDTDWQGLPFRNTATLCAMADRVHKITSTCTVCGHPASKTFKKAPNDRQVELGETNLYEARCNDHWHNHR